MHQTQTNYSLLPREITDHMAGFIVHELQATDPQCYRAARSIQAAWRARLAREYVCFVYTTHMCQRCTTNAATDRVYGSHAGRIWTCDACWSRHDYLEWDWEEDDVEERLPELTNNQQLNNPTIRLPQDINTHVVSFIADEVRAVDPQCYRSARTLQALCRGALIRMRGNVCHLCGRTQTHPHPTFYWVCDGCLDAISAGTNPITLYDLDGYDVEGYDRDGLDRAGYDLAGFDPHGYDQHGRSWSDDGRRSTDLSPWSDADGNELDYGWDFS